MALLGKTEVDLYMKKLYRFLSEGHTIEFRKMRKNRGLITLGKYSVVELDPRDSILSTLIHEFFHHIHPEWSETKVLEMEYCMMNSISSRQVCNILKRLAGAI